MTAQQSSSRLDLGRDENGLQRWFQQEKETFIAATGKPIRVGGFLQARFEGGTWAEDWVSWDQLGMLQQLGVVPTAGQGVA